MNFDQILNHAREGDAYASQQNFGAAIEKYKQARGGIRSLTQTDEKAEALMLKLTVNIVSCNILENKLDLTALDWSTLSELTTESYTVASRIEDVQLKMTNQQNSQELNKAILFKSYNDDIDILNSIEWDLYNSIDTNFDHAIQRLTASGRRFEEAGYQKDASEVYDIITDAYEKKGEALFNISGDVYGETVKTLLYASLNSYKIALMRSKRPSNKLISSMSRVVAELGIGLGT